MNTNIRSFSVHRLSFIVENPFELRRVLQHPSSYAEGAAPEYDLPARHREHDLALELLPNHRGVAAFGRERVGLDNPAPIRIEHDDIGRVAGLQRRRRAAEHASWPFGQFRD